MTDRPGGGDFTNRKIIFPVAILLLVITIGTSLAIFRMVLKQKDENTLTSACLRIDFVDENPINIQSAIPLLDEDGKKLTPYKFTIRNMCESNLTFKVNLEVLDTTTFEDLNYIKSMFNEKDPVLLTTELEVVPTIDNAKTSYNLKSGYLAAKQSVSYTLRLWMSDDTPLAEKYMEKSLKSKITIVAENYMKEIDTTAPTANFTTTMVEGGYLVDARTSTDDDSGIENYYYSTDGKNWISSKEANYVLKNNAKLTEGKAIDVINSIATKEIYDIYVKVEDKFDNMSKVVKKNVKSSDFLYDETIDNNLRYVGPTPANYVRFNNETWRIIGVMNNVIDKNGNIEKRLKLARNASIGEYSYNSSDHNEWSDSDLMKLLNPGYESKSIGGSLYWNRSAGKCINGNNNASIDCNFTSNGLTIEAREMIGDAIWHTAVVDNSTSINTIQAYTNERSNNVTCTNCGVERKPVWNGKVGLMYLSDYGYSIKNTSCRDMNLYTQWSSGSCKNTTWLSVNWDWTISPRPRDNYGHVNNVAVVGSWNGYVDSLAYSPKNVLPQVYLKESVKIVSGTGTNTDPFILSL